MLRSLVCDDRFERQARAQGATHVAGVDEVGRGALFGPVVAAAVILPEKTRLPGLRDSKQLKVSDRERLATEIHSLALAVSIAEIDAATIDRVNIYQATRLAMRTAVSRLSPAPQHLLIDAMRIDHPCPQTSITYGDSLSISIAAASVIAKVHRDGLMCQLDAQFPQYGLARHKGYATAEHRAAILQHGPCPLHRKSFAPVAQSNLFESETSLTPNSISEESPS